MGMLRRKLKIRLMSGIPSTVLLSIGLLAFTSIGYGNLARSSLLRSVFCYEMPINYIVLGGLILFLRVIDSLQSTDIGYGRLESKRALEGLRVPRSLMVGTIESNRVNLRIIFIRLCSILLFL